MMRARRLPLLLALATVAAMIFYARSSLNAWLSAADPIDMRSDHNGDQLPDELVDELRVLAAYFDNDLDAARWPEARKWMTNVIERIPFAAGTRAMQAQVEDLLAQQAAATNPDQKRVLAQQADQLLQEAEAADPVYQRALATIKRLAGEHAEIAPQDEAEPDFSQLQRGDVLLVRSGDIYLNWIYAQHYSHAGIYDGAGMVYESNPDGVRLKPLSEWQKPGHLVALGRIDNLPVDKVLAALEWAEQTYKTDGSTHYNHDIPDKWAEDKLYCSQLVWKISEHAGVDLDSNDFWYMLWISTRLGPVGPDFAIPAVLPDEIALSDQLHIYSSGHTQ